MRKLFKVAQLFSKRLATDGSIHPMDPIQGVSPPQVWDEFLTRMRRELLQGLNRSYKESFGSLEQHDIKLYLKPRGVGRDKEPRYDLIVESDSFLDSAITDVSRKVFLTEANTKINFAASYLRKLTNVPVTQRT